jgi:hypothetical protein
VKDEDKDHLVWQEYINNVMKKRGAAWRDLYRACDERNDDGKPKKAEEEEK